MLTTDGHLLGGRVSYRQPAAGFRSGIEPVLLAASIPVRAGEHVLEAGTGAGAALLCLCARVADVHATGVETDPAMAELAVSNAKANAFSGIDIVHDRVDTAVLPGSFDHAMANPPYHPPDGTVSPIAERETAKRGSDALIQTWIERLSTLLRMRGSLTLSVTVTMVPSCLTAMAAAGCPCTALFPLWPKPERRAKLVLLRGIRNARSPMRLLPGLVLHRPDGAFTAAAQAVLRDAAALSLEG